MSDEAQGPDFSDEFPLETGLVYLNHAAVAPWPRRTALAVERFAEENLRRGARDYVRWMEAERRLREQGRALVNAASVDDIAFLKNTSEALSVVAHGLPWKSGDNVVTGGQEFPSNRIVWESLREYGVETRHADFARGSTPEDALAGCVDAQTRLLSVSSVQYGSGLRVDLERLGSFCRERGVLFCVDAIQSLGALPLDVEACQADFVMADGHKWLLGPEGCALFYSRPAARDLLRLRQYGWHMVEALGDFERMDWQPAPGARRFECGSPNMLGIHALSTSLSLLLEVGMASIAERVLDNSAHLIARLGAMRKLQVLTPVPTDRHAGIVTFRPRTLAPAELQRRLTDRNIVCALRGGGVRFSPHFHTPRAHLDAAVDAVHEIVRDA